MFIVSQVADVKPKRHHVVMLGINLLVTTSLVKIFQQSSNGEYSTIRRYERDAISNDFNGSNRVSRWHSAPLLASGEMALCKTTSDLPSSFGDRL
jgi:hypothetical protein